MNKAPGCSCDLEAGNRCFSGRLSMWRKLLGAHSSSLTDLRGFYKHCLHSAGQVWLLLEDLGSCKPTHWEKLYPGDKFRAANMEGASEKKSKGQGWKDSGA